MFRAVEAKVSLHLNDKRRGVLCGNRIYIVRPLRADEVRAALQRQNKPSEIGEGGSGQTLFLPAEITFYFS